MTATSTSSASTRSARCRSTRSRRPTPATRGRRWRWPRSPTRSGSASCASTPPTRSGPTATASCSPPATPRCCSTRCSTWPGCKAVDPDYEVVGDPAVSLDDIKSFRQLDSRAPGHPEYRWTSGRRDDHRPARPGRRHLGRHGDRLASGRAPATGGRALRLRRLRDRRRRLPDGGRLQRSRLARRPPQARQPLLDLRQQPHHDRRQHRARLRATTSPPASWATAGTSPGSATPTTSSCSPRLRGVQGRGGAADADHRRQPHRLGLAAQAGHRRRPRRAARRGGGARDQARLRLARGRPVPRPRRGPRALRRRRSASAAPSCAPPGRRKLGRLRRRATPSSPPRSRRSRSASCPTAGTPASPASTPTRRGSPPARPRSKVENAIAERVPWLLAGSADLTDSTSVAAHVRRRRRLRARRLRRPPAPLRHPRARVGGDLQRPLALQAAAALVDLPDLLRLRPAGDPPLGADGAAGDPRLHPRLDRPRRGRPDPPAGRAARLAAGDPRPRRDPPRRRQRGRRGLAGGDRPHATSRSPWSSPARTCRSSTAPSTPPPRACAAAATCSPTPRAATPR